MYLYYSYETFTSIDQAREFLDRMKDPNKGLNEEKC